MSISFEPQFHKRVAIDSGRGVWIALPHPKTLIPVKAAFYRQWQAEERFRLEKEGDSVIIGFGRHYFPISI